MVRLAPRGNVFAVVKDRGGQPRDRFHHLGGGGGGGQAGQSSLSLPCHIASRISHLSSIVVTSQCPLFFDGKFEAVIFFCPCAMSPLFQVGLFSVSLTPSKETHPWPDVGQPDVPHLQVPPPASAELAQPGAAQRAGPGPEGAPAVGGVWGLCLQISCLFFYCCMFFFILSYILYIIYILCIICK